MDLTLFLKERGEVRQLKVPLFVVKDLLRDRLSRSELDRINRLATKSSLPETIKPGTVIADFSSKTAQCFNARINVSDLEPTWNVSVEKMTLMNY